MGEVHRGTQMQLRSRFDVVATIFGLLVFAMLIAALMPVRAMAASFKISHLDDVQNVEPKSSPYWIVWRGENEETLMSYDIATGIRSGVTWAEAMNGFDLDGDWLVYCAGDYSDADLYARNLYTGMSINMVPGQDDVANPAIDGERFVWQSWDQNYVSGSEDIYTMTLSGGVAQAVTTASGDQTNPQVDGDWVVWQDERNGDWDIYGKNLRTGELREIAVDEGTDETAPQVDGDWVAYVTYGEVHAYNLATGVRKAYTAHYEADFALDGGNLAWIEGNSTVGVADLSTSGSASFAAEDVTSVDLRDGLATWTYRIWDEWTWYVDAYDIQVGTVTTVASRPITESSSEVYDQVTTADGFIAWHDCYISDWFADAIWAVRARPAQIAVIKDVTEVWGPTRFRTSVEASKRAYPTGLAADGPKTVVLATGRNWPDALGGSALAGALDAPLLLTDTGEVPAEVLTEIERLGAEKAILLGGLTAVSEEVEIDLNQILGAANVDRLAGASRYETARLVAERTIDERGEGFAGYAFYATGRNFPDALAAAPAAAAHAIPLVLVPATGDPVEIAGVDTAVVLGGTSAVSSAVETNLRARLGTDKVTRVQGATRYATSSAVAEWSTHFVSGAGLGHDPVWLRWNGVAISTGQNFPDALSGGVMQAKLGSVMLLTPSDGPIDPTVADKLYAHRAEIDRLVFLGGTGALSESMRRQVAGAMR